jgi:hypothetical protein
MSTAINDVLASFSISQLRDLAFAMSSRGLKPPKSTADRKALLDLLHRKASDANLVLYAHRIEAVTPYKHLYLYSLRGGPTRLSALKSKIQSAFPSLMEGYRSVEARPGDLEPEAFLADDAQDRLYLKLVHQVEMSGWVLVDPKRKEYKEFRKRHPVVLTLRAAEGIATIAFPGFTYGQGLQREDRLHYSAIADQGVEFARRKLGIECDQFQAKPSIDSLLQEEPEDVVDIKRIVRPQKGGRFSFDAGEESKLTTAVADYFKTEGKIQVNEKQVRELLRNSAASDIVLWWKKTDLVTRVALMEHSAEFLFIWRSAGASSSVVDSVLRKLVDYSRIVARPAVQALRRSLLSTPIGNTVQPAVVAQTNGVRPEEVAEILNGAVARGTFIPVFRVNTDALLIDFANPWRRNVAELPEVVTDEHGTTIDLKTPANIEVAFQRVK